MAEPCGEARHQRRYVARGDQLGLSIQYLNLGFPSRVLTALSTAGPPESHDTPRPPSTSNAAISWLAVSQSSVSCLTSCEIRRLIGCEEANHVCDILWLADTAKRNRAQDLLPSLRGVYASEHFRQPLDCQQRGARSLPMIDLHCSIAYSRTDTIVPNFICCILSGQALCRLHMSAEPVQNMIETTAGPDSPP